MKKVLITAYYELKESILLASEALKNTGLDVISFPLYKYYADINDKDDNYVNIFNNFINKEKPDVILWWYFSIPTNDLEKIVTEHKKIKQFMFNWDEPYNWALCDIKNKAKFFDCVFITAAEKINNYIQNGTKKAIVLYPGYDTKVHHIIIDDNDDIKKKYTCDISICCTNLYEDLDKFPDQYIVRKNLVDDLYDNQEKYDYIFHIYGPKKFEKMYPNSYKGFINYYDTNYLFNYSKINICTHVQQGANKYLNERVNMILGSGGLLAVDKVNGIDKIFDVQKECVILTQNNYIEQLVEILKNYDGYYLTRFNGKQKSLEYTWDKWASIIYAELELFKQ